MSKEKKIHTKDKTIPDPVEVAAACPTPDPVEVASTPPEVDTSIPPAPSVDAIMSKLTPEEQAVLKASMRARKAKAANGTVQDTFNTALAKVNENLNDLHKIVVDFGFGDMPFELSIGTGLDGKPFVDGKRLRHREKKAKAPEAQVDAPAA